MKPSSHPPVRLARCRRDRLVDAAELKRVILAGALKTPNISLSQPDLDCTCLRHFFHCQLVIIII